MSFPLAPGSVIGILGGGQLARMLALAAGQLGLRCHIFAPETDSPAFQVTSLHTIASYDDRDARALFAAAVDVVTYEFENVPVEAVRYLESKVQVRPGSKALAVAQDRLLEKALARGLGAKTAEFVSVQSVEELKAAVLLIGLPAVLKTTRMGYDGKGQVKIMAPDELDAAWRAMRGAPAVLEQFVKFDCEVSVIAARNGDGQVATFDVTENVHRNHILHTSSVPALISQAAKQTALVTTGRLLDALDYVGVAGVEFFVQGDDVFVNEIAPRVHNSGHWTQDACVVSQFEQHIRAVAGWPLGDPVRHCDVVMTNLLGDDVAEFAQLAPEPGCAVHVYGKSESRPGRKMGHVNQLKWPKT